jgi:3'-phosphoadenosine 5'-phosphosulfate sulfotransferase (PAPS reductase)/FAD synthetase
VNLTGYDFIVVNSSAGKDSQATLDFVYHEAKAQGVESRIVVVHADLGRVEWEGTRDLAERQSAHYGARFEVVKRGQNDLLDHVKARGMWPSPKLRYCTSDHKRGPVRTLFTKLTEEHRRSLRRALLWAQSPCRILNCMGMRAQESPARAKLEPFKFEKSASNGKRHVDTWLPIHGWTVDQVWDRIRQSGVEHHYAYDLGMPRLSCMFCIFAPKNALMLAGHHNRAMLREYVQTETDIDHTFRQDLTLASIEQELEAGVIPGPVTDWKM